MKHWATGSLGRPFSKCISQTVEKEKLRRREIDTDKDQGEMKNAQRHHISPEQGVRKKNAVEQSDVPHLQPALLRSLFTFIGPLHPFTEAVFT